MTPTATLLDDRPRLGRIIDSSPSAPTESLFPNLDDIFSSAILAPSSSITRSRAVQRINSQLVDKEEEEEKFREGHVQRIIDSAYDLTQSHPRSVIAWCRLSQTLAGEGRTEDAVEAARRVFALLNSTDWNLNTEAPTFLAARVLLSANLVQEAEAFLENHHSNSKPLTILYAAIAEKRGDYAQALARLGDTSGVDFDGFRGYLYLRQGNANEAIKRLRAAGGEGSRRPDVLANLSCAFGVTGSGRKAVRCAKQAIILAPRNRNLAFNLVAFLVANGRDDDAYDELLRVRREIGDDLDVTSSLLYVLTNMGKLDEARREVRRSLAANRFRKNTVEFAELSASLANLELHMGKRSVSDVQGEIARQLGVANGRSLPLAAMYADWNYKTTSIVEIRRLYEELRKHETGDRLLPLEVRLNLLEQDYESALRNSKRWHEISLLNSDATQMHMTILGHAFAKFDEAISLGFRALKQIPSSASIRNSLAFYLVLNGDSIGARSVLDDYVRLGWPTLQATSGLIALGVGDVDKGLSLYDLAVKKFRKTVGDGESLGDFECLVRAYELIGLSTLGLINDPRVEKRFRFTLPVEWRNDSRLLLARELARKLQVVWPAHD